MNLEGLTEKWSNNPVKSRRVKFYENDFHEIVAKACSKCGSVKLLDEYVKHRKGLGGKRSECKVCVEKSDKEYRSATKEHGAEVDRKYREENKEHYKETERKYRELNKERYKELARNWRLKNPHRALLKTQRYRARKKSLPDTLTAVEYAKTLEYFENACALTGRKVDIEQEHAIPISIGHGGTTFANCYPMARGLNQSKNDSNLFEWFNENQERFNLEQWRFDRLIDWLASANAMSVEEYRAYVYECHANPNVIDADEAI